MRHRRARAHAAGDRDRWIVSYADFITLLFAFFTVMYAVSTVDAGKVAPAADSIHQAFAMAQSAPSVAPAPVTAEAMPPATPPLDDLSAVREKLRGELADALSAGRLELASDTRGLVLSLPVEATFGTGSADVHPEARGLIARIAATVQPLGNALRIEGHTDDVPIRTAVYASNWELSTARASAVVAFMIADARLAPGRLSAAGYAEFHPRVPNDSAANRARNRRVDIVILNDATRRQEPPAGGVTP